MKMSNEEGNSVPNNIPQEEEKEQIKDSKLSSKDDSINKKMQEMYDQHKKDGQVNHRPQSKYQREQEQNNKNEEQQIDEVNLIKKINDHFEKQQITKKEFSDNQNVFVPLDEFFDLFKNIHLDLTKEEINYLFSNKNPNKDDGYIYFTTFIENYDFKFYPGESTLINKSGTHESNNSNYTSLLLNKPDKMTPALQNEFNMFKNDILNIVEGSKNPHKTKKHLPPLKNEDQKRPSSKKLSQNRPSSRKENNIIIEKELINKDKENSKTQTFTNTKKKPQSAYKISTNYSKEGVQTAPKKHKVNYLKQTLQRMQLEDEMIKLAIDKRDKEFQRDCVKKMVLANEYAEKLGIQKSFSAYSEEGESTIICRVFSKTVKDFKDINLKQFLIEFKKLEKTINQQNEREKYKNNENKEIVEKKDGDFFRMDREEKHKIIKKILKESIQLKLQLKKQLKALRDKKLIDLDTLNKNLKLTNLDDDTIL